jgi:hypothetical protein
MRPGALTRTGPLHRKVFAMAFVALKQMKVAKEDGTIEQRQPGDLVPEASKWINPRVWIEGKWLKEIPDAEVSKYGAPAAAEVVEEKAAVAEVVETEVKPKAKAKKKG